MAALERGAREGDAIPGRHAGLLAAQAAPRLAKAPSAQGRLALHLAAEAGAPVAVVERLLAAFPQAAQISDARGYLPYHCARIGSVVGDYARLLQ